MTACDECGADNEPGHFEVDGRKLCRACRNDEVGDTRLPGRRTVSPQREDANRARVIQNDRGRR